MSLSNLKQLCSLLHNATSTSGSMTFYSDDIKQSPLVMTYSDLEEQASKNATVLRSLDAFKPGTIILIHSARHIDNIVWFWSAVLAGAVPAMSTPFRQDDRAAHLSHLRQLLDDPICITTNPQIRSDFEGDSTLQLYTIEDLQLKSTSFSTFECHAISSFHLSTARGFAAIMLTSGSSGRAKAVALTSAQILASLRGKIQAMPCPSGSSILNWVGLDHVAALTEAHLRALLAGMSQIHVPAAHVVSDPVYLLSLLSRHRASATFAPNFLLAKLVACQDRNDFRQLSDLDLSELQYVVSGGESCVVETCQKASEILEGFGAPRNVIVPGFGMTETCAGCIYSLNCSYGDLSHTSEFTNVGTPISGLQVRITPLASHDHAPNDMSGHFGNVGNLEISGPMVFTRYLNNQAATAESFSSDGWFRTGDIGSVDADGNLHLSGRAKEIISINGVKYSPVELESTIQRAEICGIDPDFLACFAWRAPKAHTEQVCVVYQHTYDIGDVMARARTRLAISKVILLHFGSRPLIVPLSQGILQKSTLGKLSRPKIAKALGAGEYLNAQKIDAAMLAKQHCETNGTPTTDLQKAVCDTVAKTLQVDTSEVTMNTALTDIGITSVDLIRLKRQIQDRFGLQDFPLSLLLTCNNISSIAEELESGSLATGKAKPYDPVICLQPSGTQTPLWLVHPGVGEILVFVGLSQFFEDRPIFALRAKGFGADESTFSSIDETVDEYVKAIKHHQPHGPYALAGYSYGSMLAFEMTKKLQDAGDDVGFLGFFNLPPHIKYRMRQLTKNSCLIHLCPFLQLVSDERAQTLEMTHAKTDFESLLEHNLNTSSQERFKELDIDADGLAKWASVASSLHGMAMDYEPSGMAKHMDVFYCEPLAAVASSKEEWLEKQLKRWRDFSETEPRYHSVDGEHYTMLSTDHVLSFQKSLKSAMAARGM